MEILRIIVCLQIMKNGYYTVYTNMCIKNKEAKMTTDVPKKDIWFIRKVITLYHILLTILFIQKVTFHFVSILRMYYICCTVS